MDAVDTDVLIDVQRGHPPALAWFAGLKSLPAVPGFVVMELVQDARNVQEVRQGLKLVAPLQFAWPTETDLARALSDFTAYHLSHRLGLLDALIAACALGLSATLDTFNGKHYRMVPGAGDCRTLYPVMNEAGHWTSICDVCVRVTSFEFKVRRTTTASLLPCAQPWTNGYAGGGFLRRCGWLARPDRNDGSAD